jgi:hypothetical protein
MRKKKVVSLRLCGKKIKKMQTYKPDSVPDKSEPYHLSRSRITTGLKLSTLQQRTRSP